MFFPALADAFPDCVIEHVHFTPSRLRIQVRSRSGSACCPSCGAPSTRVHSHTQRQVQDLPLLGIPVHLHVQVRRFFCATPDCPKRTFVEHLAAVTPSRVRRTPRVTDAVRVIGFALGGEAGARVAGRLGLTTSGDTVLRILRATPAPTPLSASTTSRSVVVGRMARSWLTWNAIVRSICCRRVRLRPLPPGCRRVGRSRWWPRIGRANMPAESMLVSHRRPKWRIASICCARFARPSNAPCIACDPSCGNSWRRQARPTMTPLHAMDHPRRSTIPDPRVSGSKSPGGSCVGRKARQVRAAAP